MNWKTGCVMVAVALIAIGWAFDSSRLYQRQAEARRQAEFDAKVAAFDKQLAEVKVQADTFDAILTARFRLQADAREVIALDADWRRRHEIQEMIRNAEAHEARMEKFIKLFGPQQPDELPDWPFLIQGVSP